MLTAARLFSRNYVGVSCDVARKQQFSTILKNVSPRRWTTLSRATPSCFFFAFAPSRSSLRRPTRDFSGVPADDARLHATLYKLINRFAIVPPRDIFLHAVNSAAMPTTKAGTWALALISGLTNAFRSCNACCAFVFSIFYVFPCLSELIAAQKEFIAGFFCNGTLRCLKCIFPDKLSIPSILVIPKLFFKTIFILVVYIVLQTSPNNI